MGGKGWVWDVKDSLAADTDAPYRARICHAGREICAPAARGQSGGETACLLTEASPSASSASPLASSASPTSKNARCSREISTGLLLNQGRPLGRSFLLPLRALRPSAIYARLSFLLIPFHSMKMGERKNTSFLRPVNLFSTSSYFPVNRLPLRYPWTSFACRAMARGVGGLPRRRYSLRVRADYLPIPSATLTIASKSNLGIAKRAAPSVTGSQN